MNLNVNTECPCCSLFYDPEIKGILTDEIPVCTHEIDPVWSAKMQSMYLPNLNWKLVPRVKNRCAIHTTMANDLKCFTCSSSRFCFLCLNKLHFGHRIISSSTKDPNTKESTSSK